MGLEALGTNTLKGPAARQEKKQGTQLSVRGPLTHLLWLELSLPVWSTTSWLVDLDPIHEDYSPVS